VGTQAFNVRSGKRKLSDFSEDVQKKIARVNRHNDMKWNSRYIKVGLIDAGAYGLPLLKKSVEELLDSPLGEALTPEQRQKLEELLEVKVGAAYFKIVRFVADIFSEQLYEDLAFEVIFQAAIVNGTRELVDTYILSTQEYVDVFASKLAFATLNVGQDTPTALAELQQYDDGISESMNDILSTVYSLHSNAGVVRAQVGLGELFPKTSFRIPLVGDSWNNSARNLLNSSESLFTAAKNITKVAYVAPAFVMLPQIAVFEEARVCHSHTLLTKGGEPGDDGDSLETILCWILGPTETRRPQR
jgi:hypothetical protein